jgi:hypothetical protein
VIHGNDFLAIQKHLIAARFVCASTVPVGDCQNTAAIGHGVNSKVIRSSARFIRRASKEEPRVYTGRVARELLWMSHSCLLSRQMGGADETQKDDSKPIRVSPSSERFRAHFAENTTINSSPKFPIRRLRRHWNVRTEKNLSQRNEV